MSKVIFLLIQLYLHAVLTLTRNAISINCRCWDQTRADISLPLTSETEQREWTNYHLVEKDQNAFGPYVITQPYCDQIAEVLKILPTRNDYLEYGEEYAQMYDRLQNDILFPSQFRLVGTGKHPKAMEWLKQAMQISQKETKEIQEIVCQTQSRSNK